MRILRIARLFVLTVVAVLLAVAAGLSIHKALFLKHSSVAQGEVIASIARTDSEGTVNYCPQFNFVTADGRSYTVASSTCTNPASFAEHERVKVVFNPSNPKGAEIDSFLQIWFVPLVLGFIALAWLLFAAILFFFERWIRRRAVSAP